jgi:hypothetical protein
VSELRNLALALADALGVDVAPYLHHDGEDVACGALIDVVRLMRPIVGPWWPIVHPSVEVRAAIRAARDEVDACGALTALHVLPRQGAPRYFDIGLPTGAAAGDVYALAMDVAVQLGVDDRPYLLSVDGDPLALAVGLLRDAVALVAAGTVAPHVRAAIAAARLPTIAPTRPPVSLTAILAASGLRR